MSHWRRIVGLLLSITLLSTVASATTGCMAGRTRREGFIINGVQAGAGIGLIVLGNSENDDKDECNGPSFCLSGGEGTLPITLGTLLVAGAIVGFLRSTQSPSEPPPRAKKPVRKVAPQQIQQTYRVEPQQNF